MPLLAFSFLLGGFNGSRTIVPATVLCWFAFFGRLHTSGTWFAFLAEPLVVAILTTAFLAELLVDKLPMTPSRLKAPLLIGRLCAGGFSGAVLASALFQGTEKGALLGASGALLGALIGYWLRTGIVRWTKLPGFLVAVAEDAITIGSSIMIVAMALSS